MSSVGVSGSDSCSDSGGDSGGDRSGGGQWQQWQCHLW